MYVQVSWRPKEGPGFHGTGVRGGCEPFETGAGNLAQASGCG